MTPGYPQYSPSAKQGNLGVSIVSRVVEAFGWLFKKNPQEFDFGIDGQIEIVSDAGAVTGQILACQVKCGRSYLAESNRWGYVYRGETKHFNYLANYPIPVIIVICDPDSGEGFWAQFLAPNAQITTAGWRVTIPFENKLSVSKVKLIQLLPPLTDQLSRLEEYWRINNLILGSEVILFTIDREEVVAGDLSRAKEFRARLTCCKELALHCQGKIQISFNGYDDDPSELFEIEEVRRYIVLLDEILLELFFFVRTDPPANTLMLFCFSLYGCGWEGERSKPGRPGKRVVDHSAMAPWLKRHFWGLNVICEWVGLPEEDIERISLAVMKPLGYEPDAGAT